MDRIKTLILGKLLSWKHLRDDLKDVILTPGFASLTVFVTALRELFEETDILLWTRRSQSQLKYTTKNRYYKNNG